jgi:cytochrome c biogenesis protein CcmG/thiol:disulfide interchange protein DsbE
MSTSSSGGGLSTRTIGLIFGGLLVVLLALAFLGGDGDGGTGTDVLALPPAEVTGEALPGFTGDTASDPAVGTAAPEVSGPAIDGSGEVSFPTDGDGPTIVVFLAHWCPHCQREAPVIQRWIEGGGLEGTGVDLVGVATGIDEGQPNFPPDAWLDRIGWTSPTVVDNDRTVSDAYGLNAFPFWTIVDEDGEVMLRFTGELGEERLDQLVADITSEG